MCEQCQEAGSWQCWLDIACYWDGLRHAGPSVHVCLSIESSLILEELHHISVLLWSYGIQSDITCVAICIIHVSWPQFVKKMQCESYIGNVFHYVNRSLFFLCNSFETFNEILPNKDVISISTHATNVFVTKATAICVSFCVCVCVTDAGAKHQKS